MSRTSRQLWQRLVDAIEIAGTSPAMTVKERHSAARRLALSLAAAIASPSAAMRIGSLATEIPSGARASLTALEIAAGAPR
jgi:hypothetical protein